MNLSQDLPQAPERAAAMLRGIRADERASLLDWLDDGLRDGRRGTLTREFPLSLSAGALHRVVEERGRIVAHAMAHRCVLRNGSRALRVGLIGLVYTDPAARGRGFARRCIEACCEALRAAGTPLALLWSDKHDFYRRMDFHPVGHEFFFSIDAERCAQARGSGEAGFGGSVRAPIPSDWELLERLYEEKPLHVERPHDALRQLAAAPATRVLVASEHTKPVAYAALGRGDDFQGVVHEWAGEPRAVLTLLHALCLDTGPLLWLSGPRPDRTAELLCRTAAPEISEGIFALGRVLDGAQLWRTVTGEDPEHGAPLGPCSDAELIDVLFGSGLASPVASKLEAQRIDRLREQLPYPLYTWGFDSI